jgi:hypothetical protein
MKAKKLFRLVIFSFALIFWNCSEDGILTNELYSDLSEKGGKKVITSGDDTETVGNNLSFPVIWSDGIAKDLRGTEGEVSLTGTWWGVWSIDPIDPQAPLYSCGPYLGDVVPCAETEFKAYIQKDALNQWQASNWIADEPVYVNSIDWGDNLESIDWNLKSQVRVETVLYKNLDNPVTEYAMRHCDSWGEDEVHGLQTDMDNVPVKELEGQGMRATVYTPNARLTIQKLEVDNLDNISEKVKWRARDGWTEADDYVGSDVVNDTPLFNMVINDASDGPGFYNAEVNVKGKVIFGFTWNVRQLNDKEGYYRITFSFDPETNLNTFFDKDTEILLPIEEVAAIAIAAKEDDGEDARGGEAIIDVQNNLTYMDILITPKTTGGGGGGNSGGGNGSGGGNH